MQFDQSIIHHDMQTEKERFTYLEQFAERQREQPRSSQP
jgi:hypothetical protein